MKKLIHRLFNDRGARDKWEESLVWFRLRYREPSGPNRCLQLLSRPEACGRLALSFTPGPTVSVLRLGVPVVYARLVGRMAADFGFRLAATPFPTGPVYPLVTASSFPWKRPFVAHIVDGALFVDLEEAGKGNGRYLPQATGAGPAAWAVPVNPPPGVTTTPLWPASPPPPELVAHGATHSVWPLGQARDRTPLSATGQMNIYGSQGAVADWLDHQLAQVLAVDPVGLLVVDGGGDVVPRLKRKAVVTGLLGDRLTYLDLNGPPLTGGFNPLAPLPEEPAAVTLVRWQQWFTGMGVLPASISLLAAAQHDGVGDLPTLRKWLDQRARGGKGTAVSGLQIALQRLTAERTLLEWLEWPTNPFQSLADGALLVSCPHDGWGRRQLLQVLLLAACQTKKLRVVLHQFPWEHTRSRDFHKLPTLLITNGPHLEQGVTLLVAVNEEKGTVLADRFFEGDVVLTENLALLQRGEAICVGDGFICPVWWSPPAQSEENLE